MEYSYLYEFNRERYEKLAERQFMCREDLQSVVIENGYMFPNRYAQNRLFGHGGVLNQEQVYVTESEMNAYAKYASIPKETDEKEIYLGEGYEIAADSVPYLDEDVIYLGYINNHWGHFLLDSTTRLYTCLQDEKKQYKYAYLVNEGQDYTPVASISRFFELLGISDRIIFINQITKCRSITIPEQGYMINAYYSKEFLGIFQRVADAVDCTKYETYQKVYYSRANVKKAKGSEIGEDILLELFEKNNFTIISPERCSLDEQIAIVRNSEFLAGITGTLPHNLLFAKPGKKMLVINKTHNMNVAQMDINIMCQIDMTYVDAYYARFPVMIGEGPFLLTYSDKLDEYIRDHQLETLNREKVKAQEKENSRIYEERYRVKHMRSMQLHYQKDRDRFDYFAAEHLLQYDEAFYSERCPIRIKERLIGMLNRMERVVKRIMKK